MNRLKHRRGQAAIEYFVIATAVFVAVLAVWGGVRAAGSGSPGSDPTWHNMFNDFVNRINPPGGA